MSYKNKNLEKEFHIQPQEIPTYAIQYHDYDANENVFVTTKEGKRLEFYDSAEADDFAWFYSRTEGVYAAVVQV